MKMKRAVACLVLIGIVIWPAQAGFSAYRFSEGVVFASGIVEAQEVQLSPACQDLSLAMAGRPEPLSWELIQPEDLDLEKSWDFSPSLAFPNTPGVFAPQPVGRIKRIKVSLGDEVKKGQPLVVIDNPLLELQVSQAEAGVTLLEATLRLLDERREDLEGKLDKAETGYTQAKQGLKEAQEALTAFQSKMAGQRAKAQSEHESLLASYNQALQKVAEAEQASWNNSTHPNYSDYLVLLAEAQALEEAVAEAESGLKALEKGLSQSQAKLKSAVAKLRRTVGQLRSVISYLETAVSRVEKGRKVAEAQLQLAQTIVQKAQKEKENLTLRSPWSGVVTNQLANEGEIVFAGQPLLAISKLARLEVRVYLPPVTARLVRSGQKVNIYTDSYPRRTFKGVVTGVGLTTQFLPSNISTSQIHPSQAIEVVVEAANPEGILKPGLPVDAVIETGS